MTEKVLPFTIEELTKFGDQKLIKMFEEIASRQPVSRLDDITKSKARQTQEILQNQLLQSGGVDKNLTNSNFYSGATAKDLTSEKPVVGPPKKKKFKPKRF